MDLENIYTPVDPEKLRELLIQTKYGKTETDFLYNGFKYGFDIGCQELEDIQIRQKAPNLKFTVGNKTELWNKVMKEVQLKRYAGPFESIPFSNFIQSPIGLVPKDNGTKTRLIFHLSYPRNGISVNSATPEERKSVKYPSFDEAIKLCQKIGSKGKCRIAKSDLSAAFRHFGIRKEHWKILIMKAIDPQSGKTFYFVDKCMPFGAAISCSHFQRFSNALAHIVTYFTSCDNINYLDDFFFVGDSDYNCNIQVRTFIRVCDSIHFPVSKEKTFWSSEILSFLGLVINTITKTVNIPVDKVKRALEQIEWMLNKKSKKVKLRDLERLTGFLNFIGKAIIPGRAFTRRLYSHGAHLLNRDHHLRVTKEMRMDLELWKTFLLDQAVYATPFINIEDNILSKEIDWYTDASANPKLGAGGYSGSNWFILQWEEKTLKKFNLSINYLELFAVAVAIFNWIGKYRNRHIIIFCDNMSVVQMLNNNSSKCKHCMILIRLVVLKTMWANVKLTLKHVKSENNEYADHLSRLRYKQFRQLAHRRNKLFDNKPTPIPEELWPMSKLLF